jgi:hypothetical protein
MTSKQMRIGDFMGGNLIVAAHLLPQCVALLSSIATFLRFRSVRLDLAPLRKAW